MINRIIYYSIHHKFVVLLLLAAIVGGGLYSMRNINVDSTPDITDNQVQVITSAPNLSTLDIEQFVTYPVELAMANLPGVEDIRSVSRFGLSVVTVVCREEKGFVEIQPAHTPQSGTQFALSGAYYILSEMKKAETGEED